MLRGFRRRRPVPRHVLVEYGETCFTSETALRIKIPTATTGCSAGSTTSTCPATRISTIEVESALVDHREVAEAAVAARNNRMTASHERAFVTLKGGGEASIEKLEELRDHVRGEDRADREARQHRLQRPRSGKIMHRLLGDMTEEPAARRHDDAARRSDRRRRLATGGGGTSDEG